MFRRIISLGSPRHAPLAMLSGLAIFPAAAAPALGSDVLVRYFDRNTVTLSSAIAGYAYDPTLDAFYVTGFLGQPQATYRVSPTAGRTDELTFDGQRWDSGAGPAGSGFSSVNLIGDTPWNLFSRSTDLNANAGQGNAQPSLWSGQPVPGNLRLNPAAVTVEGVTYQPGTMAVFTDGMLIREGKNNQLAASKLVYTYDLRQVDLPGATPGNNTGRDRDGDGIIDWNDVFSVVLTRQSLQSQINPTGTLFNQARDFAFAGDGQGIYINDSQRDFGGLYHVGLTTGVATRLLDTSANPYLNVEPAVLATTALDLDPGDNWQGDQLLFESTPAAGADRFGGIDYMVVDGTTASPVRSLLSANALQNMIGTSETSITSITADASSGRVYFFESDSDTLFQLDPTTGLVAKVVSDLQRNSFQDAYFGGNNDSVLDLNTRQVSVTLDGEAFTVTEVLFSDAVFDAPIGALVFLPGDVNRDNVVDLDDDVLFQAQQATTYAAAEAAGGDALSRYLAADLTGDNIVNSLDRSLFLAWNTSIPEPGTAVLAVLAGLGLLRRRTRRGC